MSTENELANELLTYKYESNTLIFCSVDMLNEISKGNVLKNRSKWRNFVVLEFIVFVDR